MSREDCVNTNFRHCRPYANTRFLLGFLGILYFLRGHLSLWQHRAFAWLPYQFGIAIWGVYGLEQIGHICHDDSR